jgi:hypothetical protein
MQQLPRMRRLSCTCCHRAGDSAVSEPRDAWPVRGCAYREFLGAGQARILAASRGTSVSQLLARMLRELVEQETGYARARERSLARLRDGLDLGTGGHIGWSRDSLHER